MTDFTALPIGFCVGVLGTLIGAGGGFLLVPIIVLLEPAWSTQTVTAFSLAVVSANALAGSFSYWRLRRIDVVSFPLFALAATPGAIAGAYLSTLIPRRTFDVVFGCFIVVAAGFLAFAPHRGRAVFGGSLRTITDSDGVTYQWTADMRLGILGTALAGLVSSLLGIGGGVVHVPFLVSVLGYPEHVATATSHAVLAVTASLATVIHVVHGDFRDDAGATLLCCGGALLGAPCGALLSKRLSGHLITRILAAALAVVGIRLLVSALFA